MKKQPVFQNRLFLFYSVLLFNLLCFKTIAQAPPPTDPIKLSWDVNVGCQIFSPPKERELFVEDIGPSTCIKVCESSKVTYTLSGTLGTNPNVQWSITGGTAGTVTNTATSSTIQVTWGTFGTGNSVTFTMNNPNGNGVITKSLCIEIIKKPQALFTTYPMFDDGSTKPYIYGCVGQNILFQDLSTTNGGSDIVSYYWDFGDGSYYQGQNPTHIYNQPIGNNVLQPTYVTLTITNSCGCSSVIKRRVSIRGRGGFEISCPGVVCEGQTSTYNMPPGICEGYEYSVDGGSFVNPNDGSVTVTWNHVDATGFGLVTFYPGSDCQLDCLVPTTIKIPVIQTVGTITGKTNLCLGEQERYKLPQWPTTDFHWSVVGNVGTSLATVINTDQRNEVIIQPTAVGTITLLCTYENTFLHCGGTATLTINVNSPEPVTGPDRLCINSSGTYHTNSGQPVDWTLKKSNLVLSTVSSNTNFSYNFTIAGNYSLTVSGPNVCDNQTINITVNPIPPAPVISNITVPTGILPTVAVPNGFLCPDASYTFSVTVPNPNMDYTWTIAGGTISGSSNDSEVAVVFNQTGPWALYLTQKIKGQPTCVSPTLTITPNVFTINAAITNTQNTPLTPTLTSCANILATYYAVNSTNTGLYNDGETYTWSITPSNLGSIVSTGAGSSSVTVMWNNVTAATTAHLNVLITRCTRSTTVTKDVIINPLPVLNLTTTDLCSGNYATFNLTSTNGVAFNQGTTITWDYGDGNTTTQTLSSSSTSIVSIHDYWTNTSGPINYTISATINTPNGCAGSVTKTVILNVYPGPTVNISNTGGNLFCSAALINATLTATYSTGTIKWYKYPYPNVLGTGNTLVIGNNSNTGAGSYYFIATSALNCKTRSAYETISVTNCSPPPTCTLTPYPVITVNKDCGITPAPANCNYNSTNNVCVNCGNLALLATATIPPVASNWTIVGPDLAANVEQVSGCDLYRYHTPITAAGIYHISYKATYMCNNAPSVLTTNKDITVPYVPTFNTAVVCNGSTYTITATNTSSYMGTVSSRRYFFFYNTSPTGPWTVINSTSATTVSFTRPPGTYYIRMVIDGIQQGQSTYSPTCEKISDPIILQAAPLGEEILADNPNCYNDPVQFSKSSPISGESYLWTFDADNSTGSSLALATNTLISPTRVFDEMPNGAARTVKITLKIINRNGCERTLEKIITIPARYYYGNMVASSAPICKGGNYTVSYQQDTTHPDNFPVTQYQWLKDNVVIATTNATTLPSPTSYTFTGVTGTSFYSLRLINPSGCFYNCSAHLSPTYLPAPTAQISAPSVICQLGGGTATATTNANTIQWFIDGALQTSTTTTLSLNSVPLGNHTITLSVSNTPNGCSKTVTQNFSVQARPGVPSVSYVVEDCNTYKIRLIASPPAGGTGTLTWSSGSTTNPAIVYAGGPYMVTYNDGSGCTSTAQLDVPYSADKYMWIFPTGCYSECKDNLGTILGPSPWVAFNHWAWLENSNDVDHGGGSPVNAYTPFESGEYNLSLQTACPQVSGTMNLEVHDCSDCKIKEVKVDKIQCKDNANFNAYQLTLFVNSDTTLTGTIYDANNQLLFNTAGITLVPGANSIPTIEVIPTNGFAGGLVTLYIEGIDSHGGRCLYRFQVEFPYCSIINPHPIAETMKSNGSKQSNFALFPNPAKEEVTISFDLNSKAPAFEIYDLTGRLVNHYEADNSKGDWNVNTSTMAAGIYIVVLKENGNITMQKKLIIEQ